MSYHSKIEANEKERRGGGRMRIGVCLTTVK